VVSGLSLPLLLLVALDRRRLRWRRRRD
jgi:hypothetical protein